MSRAILIRSASLVKSPYVAFFDALPSVVVCKRYALRRVGYSAQLATLPRVELWKSCV